MASAKDLVAAVRSRKAAGTESESVQAYWKRQREHWIADLAGLREQVKAWLAPVVEARAAQTRDVEHAIEEPDLGHYMAPGLDIELLAEPAQVVTLRPRGMGVGGLVEPGRPRLVGPVGRVDLECGARREILLRFLKGTTTTWCSFGDGHRHVLTEAFFFDLLFRTSEIERVR